MGMSWLEQGCNWAEHKVLEAERRIAKIEERNKRIKEGVAQDAAFTYNGISLDSPAADTQGEVIVYIAVFSACAGRPFIVGADVYLYNKYNIPISFATTNEYGIASLVIPNDPNIADDANTVALNALEVHASRYSKGFLYRLGDVRPASLVFELYPNTTTGYSMLPSIRIPIPAGGSGFSAVFRSVYELIVNAYGNNYADGVAVSLDGYYGDGWSVQSLLGIAANPTVVTPGSGYGAFFPSEKITATGANATIQGVVANLGLPTWTIPNAGSVQDGVILTVVASPTFAPPGVTRQASVGITLTAGAVSAATVIDPGLGYSNTITATVTGIGRGADMTGTISGGSISAVALSAVGQGYKGTPTVTISGTGAVGLGYNAGAIGTLGTTRNAHLYGRFGTIARPVRLTGLLSNAMGSVDIGSRGRVGNSLQTFNQYCLGSLVNYATFPSTLRTAYYPVTWMWSRQDCIAIFRGNFVGGALASISVVKAGYGYDPAIDLHRQSLYYNVTISGNDYALVTLTFTAGVLTGATINHAGSGYYGGGSGTSGDQAVFVEPRNGEYELSIHCVTGAWPILDGGDGKDYPTGAMALGSGSAVSNPIYVYPDPANLLTLKRASSYSESGGVVSASFNFAGTAAAWPIFQGASNVVTYSES